LTVSAPIIRPKTCQTSPLCAKRSSALPIANGRRTSSQPRTQGPITAARAQEQALVSSTIKWSLPSAAFCWLSIGHFVPGELLRRNGDAIDRIPGPYHAAIVCYVSEKPSPSSISTPRPITFVSQRWTMRCRRSSTRPFQLQCDGRDRHAAVGQLRRPYSAS